MLAGCGTSLADAQSLVLKHVGPRTLLVRVARLGGAAQERLLWSCLLAPCLVAASTSHTCPSPPYCQVGHTLQNDLKVGRGEGNATGMRMPGTESAGVSWQTQWCNPWSTPQSPPHCAGSEDGARPLHRFGRPLPQPPGAVCCLHAEGGCATPRPCTPPQGLPFSATASSALRLASSHLTCPLVHILPSRRRACPRCHRSSCWPSACWGAASRRARTTATPMPPAPWRQCRWGAGPGPCVCLFDAAWF